MPYRVTGGQVHQGTWAWVICYPGTARWIFSGITMVPGHPWNNTLIRICIDTQNVGGAAGHRGCTIKSRFLYR